MNYFKSFYVRPCLEFDDGVQSYQDHQEFYTKMSELQERKHNDASFQFKSFWTVFGVNQDGLSDAISDMSCEAAANEMMQKITYHNADRPELYKEVLAQDLLADLCLKHIKSWVNEEIDMADYDIDFNDRMAEHLQSFSEYLAEQASL